MSPLKLLKLPSLYWHCRASVNAQTVGQWDSVVNDYSLEQLKAEIVTPWKKGKGIFLKGNRFHSDRSNIQIVHTPNNALSYSVGVGYLQFVTNMVRDKEPLDGIGKVVDQHGMIPFSAGQDYTSKFLDDEDVTTDENSKQMREKQISLRALLSDIKFSDSDIQAICLDLYPGISSQFSAGMDRQHKLNLLFAQADLSEIYSYLERMHPEQMRAQHPAKSNKPK